MTATQVNHEYWMHHALRLAQRAASAGEVPVGAVVVKGGSIVGEGANASRSSCDPTAHAEIQALRAAAKRLGNYRLDGCTMYVTLEPCTMCSGAMLHARLDCVVYGAQEPKTGAAGSVLDVFSYPQINHQTQIVRGVLTQECADLLANFFQQRRVQKKAIAQAQYPLKDNALRHSDQVFAEVGDCWPFTPKWLTGDVLQGLRMAVVDQGAQDAPLTWLCLHGEASWSCAFAHAVQPWLCAGHRVVVPDLPGFGRSDQPKREKAHTAEWHQLVLEYLIQKLDLQRVVLVAQGFSGHLGLACAVAMPDRFVGAWLQQMWPQPNALTEPYAQWLKAAGNKSSWSISQGLLDASCWPITPDLIAHMAIPFEAAGHRAALNAWSRVIQEMPPLPHALLKHWLDEKRLLIECNLDNLLMPFQSWEKAWYAVLPELERTNALRATHSTAKVPAQVAANAQQAMEYFAVLR